MFLSNCLAVFLFLFLSVRCQEYDFGAEITRQCLVPDPVGLLDCVENKVTLPYLKSWVDCTNSLGENVQTSADIINYRCKSVWEGKGVIPEVFYIKDCVIEKTGLPPKNVSAEVLGAYKECERSPTSTEQNLRTKSAPIQQQQIAIPPPQQTSSIKTAASLTAAAPAINVVQQQQNIPVGAVPNYAPQMPIRQPYSQQYFIMYPTPVQQSNPSASSVTYDQNPSNQPLSQQQVPAFSSPQQSAVPNTQTQQRPAPYVNQQQVPAPYINQQQVPAPYINQQQVPVQSYGPQVPVQSYGPQVQSYVPQPTQNFPMYGSIPNGAYYYGFEVHHPQRKV